MSFPLPNLNLTGTSEANPITSLDGLTIGGGGFQVGAGSKMQANAGPEGLNASAISPFGPSNLSVLALIGGAVFIGMAILKRR